MKIRIIIPTMLRHECEGEAELATDADSVSDALIWLKSEHPKLYRNVCLETNQVRPHVNLFVNNELVFKDSLETRFSENDELFILPSVSGG